MACVRLEKQRNTLSVNFLVLPFTIRQILVDWISDRLRSESIYQPISLSTFQSLPWEIAQRLFDWERKDQSRLEALNIAEDRIPEAISARLDLLWLISKNELDCSSCAEIEGLKTRKLVTAQNAASILPNLWQLSLPLALQLVGLRQQQELPLIQGIVGVQGSGKSTLANILQVLIQQLGYTCLAFSLDDLYRSYSDRLELQKKDPRIIWRGVPGTHDHDLGINILQRLREGQSVEIPRFDKSAFDGAGDRLGYELVKPVDIVLFEGWFVGMRPLPQIEYSAQAFPQRADWQFAQDMNRALADYLPLWKFLDRLIVLDPQDYRWSLDWRREAEQAMALSGKSAMNDLQIEQFVRYFWRALHPDFYLSYLISNPNWVDLVVSINRDRQFAAIYKLSAFGDSYMHPKNILIISSVTEEQEYLTELLSDMGRVQGATEPNLAIASIQLTKFDLILLSVGFDRDKGYQFCQKLVEEHQIKIPILLISSPTLKFELKKGVMAGAVDYIAQPWEEDQILHRLERCWLSWCLQQQVDESKSNLREMAIALADAQAQLTNLEKLDYITQIFNRSFFYEQLEHEWRRLAREKESLAVVVFEIDYFRQLNALYGHQSGDDCLQKVADVVRNILKRPADLVARFGDQEFALLLPKTDSGGAIHVARSIQKDLQNLDLPQGNITLSIGISSTVPLMNFSSELFLQTGEQALAEAIEQGRDRIILKAFEAPISEHD
jgi:D-glycerate 3-kinase